MARGRYSYGDGVDRVVSVRLKTGCVIGNFSNYMERKKETKNFFVMGGGAAIVPAKRNYPSPLWTLYELSSPVGIKRL